MKITDLVDKFEVETKIRSCSELDGLNSIDCIIKTYNNLLPLNTIQEFCESKTFCKALKFTGKHSILNEILNDEQLDKCQKYWLYKNIYMKNKWSSKCISFIEKTNWAIDFIKSKGYSMEYIEDKMRDDEE